MLRVTHDKYNIEIRFYYEKFEPFQLEDLTGESFDGSRRCSVAKITVNNEFDFQGISICHPDDNFCRSIGRKRALAEALSLWSDKSLRATIWKEYLSKCKS